MTWWHASISIHDPPVKYILSQLIHPAGCVHYSYIDHNTQKNEVSQQDVLVSRLKSHHSSLGSLLVPLHVIPPQLSLLNKAKMTKTLKTKMASTYTVLFHCYPCIRGVTQSTCLIIWKASCISYTKPGEAISLNNKDTCLCAFNLQHAFFQVM